MFLGVSACVLRQTRVLIMVLIRDIVHQALATGYLTIAAENQLRQLLTTKYDREDLNAFMTLQRSASTGLVQQESRELSRSQQWLAS